MKRQRRKHTPEFKAKVALEAIKGIKTLSEISKEYEVHPVMVSAWKKDMMERLPEVFEKKNTKKDKLTEKETEQLQRKVGQLTMEVDFLEKKCRQLGITGKERSS
ncbi:IS3 family transposase [Desulfofustis glycolicus]|uniref:Transposase n=1 Tax=Desulfofustis glycolicus DSM 9705 TaxID=1121409 RepID=A0A1M5XAP5_9BACT|nr:IS3 family transposase [Desulfofustis glycolicus]MCB2218195.1 IS3 family transposase [Desulfobulbaceae bacterium]SHH96799.1 Transposase [Desulfofustis glycolicus DSM 9705]